MLTLLVCNSPFFSICERSNIGTILWDVIVSIIRMLKIFKTYDQGQGQGKMLFERWVKDKKVPEYVTMRKKTVDISIRSWLCSTQVGSSSAVNLRLGVNRLEIGLIYLINIRRYTSIQFNSIPFHSVKYDHPSED